MGHSYTIKYLGRDYKEFFNKENKHGENKQWIEYPGMTFREVLTNFILSKTIKTGDRIIMFEQTKPYSYNTRVVKLLQSFNHYKKDNIIDSTKIFNEAGIIFYNSEAELKRGKHYKTYSLGECKEYKEMQREFKRWQENQDLKKKIYNYKKIGRS